ncbi:MAG: hypothetical protein DMF61_12445 [Blastocatellia bacterium AA13]|nr:MAG: hypothetical protein DMF61_12445 [Blastocatellia bacterium AA13]
MKRYIVSGLVIAVAMASVIGMFMRPAHAAILTFTAQLLAGNEVAPVAVAASEQGANGTAIVTIDTVANTATFVVTGSGLPAGDQIILAHIHQGNSVTNGAVVIDSGLSPSTPIVVSSGGGFSFTRSGLTGSPATIQAIIANPAGFYFNIHTILSPNGVARGQLAAQATGGALPAPTLSQWGAILMTLLIIAACTFFMVGRLKVASVGNEAAGISFGSAKAIDWALLAKVSMYVETLTLLVLLALKANAVDFGGALTSGLVISFIIHLLIRNSRR